MQVYEETKQSNVERKKMNNDKNKKEIMSVTV